MKRPDIATLIEEHKKQLESKLNYLKSNDIKKLLKEKLINKNGIEAINICKGRILKLNSAVYILEIISGAKAIIPKEIGKDI